MYKRQNELQVEPLDSKSPLYSDITKFAAGVTQDAVTDTAENLDVYKRQVYRSNKQSEDLDQCWASDCDQAKSPSSGAIYDCDGVVCTRTGTRLSLIHISADVLKYYIAAQSF